MSNCYVPAELIDGPHWVGWALDAKGKKPPKSSNGRRPNVFKPGAGEPYDTIFAAFGGKNIGRIITAWLVCIDLDGCYSTDGKLAPWAREIILRCRGVGFAERSPNGGIHIWVKGELPNGESKLQKKFEGNHCGIDLLGTGAGYATVSGLSLENVPDSLLEDLREIGSADDGQAVIDWIICKWMHRSDSEQPAANEFKSEQTNAPDCLEPPNIEQDLNYRKVAELLKFIPPAEEFDPWIRIGLAIKHELGDDGFELWRTWSARAKNHDGFDATYEKWEELEPDGRIGIGSLVHWARAGGFIMPDWWHEMPNDWGGVEMPESAFEGEAGGKLFPIISAKELDEADYSVTYLVDGILTAQNAIMAAPSKSMKTTLCIDLALSLATGKPFAGKFVVPNAVSVLFMSGESGLATLQETARRIAKSKGLKLSEVGGFFVSDKVPWLFNKKHMGELEKLLDETKPKVLICDPVYQMIDGQKAENMFLMGQQLARIAKLCADRGILLILVHHAKQTSPNAKGFQPLELGDIAWAGFEQFARQWLFLSRREDYEPGTGLHKVWFSYGGSAGHSGLWGLDIAEGPNSIAQGREYAIEVKPAEETRKQASGTKAESKRQADAKKRETRIAEKCQRITDYLTRTNQPATVSTFKRELSISGSDSADCISRLMAFGEIETIKVTIQKIERDAYQIAPQAEVGGDGPILSDLFG